MLENKPKVTFVMPVHNGEAFLADSIRSLLRQTIKDIELLICDDGSTDGSVDIIKHFVDSNDNVKSYPIAHKGAAFCRNFANHFASSDIICVCDAGDLNHETRAEETYKYFEEHPDVDIYASGVAVINSMNQDLYYEFPQDLKSSVKPIVSHPTVAYRKAVSDAVKYRELTKESDLYEAFLLEAVFNKGFKFGFVPSVYVKKRQGTTRNLREAYAYRREVYKEFGIPIPEFIDAYLQK